MDQELRHFWLMRLPDTEFRVPVLHEEVADTFRASGWVVTQLPISALEEADVRCLETAKEGGSGCTKR